MKILITGGAGYIGTELAYELERNPEVSEVVIYDNLSRGNYNLFIGRHKFESGKVRFVHYKFVAGQERQLGRRVITILIGRSWPACGLLTHVNAMQ